MQAILPAAGPFCSLAKDRVACSQRVLFFGNTDDGAAERRLPGGSGPKRARNPLLLAEFGGDARLSRGRAKAWHPVCDSSSPTL